MSRVHEALSRARAENGGTAQPASSTDAGGVPLFPLEGQEAGSTWVSETPIDAAGAVPIQEPEVVEPLELTKPPAPADTESDDGQMFGDKELRFSAKLVLSPETDHGSIEQYRRLAGLLHLAQAEQGIKVVMIASALPGEGKTLTATNLALTLSESYQRDVLLIDGDLRRPSIHEMFRIPNVSGLNDGLRSEPDRKIPLVRWSDHLTLITAGRPDPDPMKVLVSARMKKVISEAATKFQWVIIDTPPVGLLTDASLFSAMVDTAVLVIQAKRTRHVDIQRAAQAIGRQRIFGVVLNRTASDASAGYNGYRYRYSYDRGAVSK